MRTATFTNNSDNAVVSTRQRLRARVCMKKKKKIKSNFRTPLRTRSIVTPNTLDRLAWKSDHVFSPFTIDFMTWNNFPGK